MKDPRYNYDIIGYYEKDSLKGYIIYNTGIAGNTYIIDLEANNDDEKIIEALLCSVEFATYKLNRKLIVALTIVDGSPFQKLIKQNSYLRNPFSRGPLTNRMDFDILIDGMRDGRLSDKSNWHICPLSYDAIQLGVWQMNILGISCFYHDSAACLVKDGEIIEDTVDHRSKTVQRIKE